MVAPRPSRDGVESVAFHRASSVHADGLAASRRLPCAAASSAHAGKGEDSDDEPSPAGGAGLWDPSQEFLNLEDGTGNFGEKTMDNAVAMLMAKTGRGFSLKRENKTKVTLQVSMSWCVGKLPVGSAFRLVHRNRRMISDMCARPLMLDIRRLLTSECAVPPPLPPFTNKQKKTSPMRNRWSSV
ncbi:unnamed protein product [Ectocarpus sp. CCAP 1310/34]|nr:unnamed protein product [Ectocarpus sp. CCAP 1310/34]